MFEESEYLTSSEQLVAFLDGELSQEESSTLFYELAQNPELQEEMRQHVGIRNTLRNSQIAPPPQLKTNILKGAGLYYSPLNSMIASASRITALLIAFLFNRTSFAVMMMSLLAVGTYFVYNLNYNKSENDSNILSNNDSESHKIPVMESSIAQNDGNIQKQSNLTYPAKSFKSDYAYKSKTTAKEHTDSGINAENFDSGDFNNKINDVSANSEKLDFLDDSQSFFFILPSNLLESFDFTSLLGKGVKIQKFGSNHADLFSKIMQNTNFYFKKYGATSYPDFNLNRESDPLFNDLIFGIKYNLDESNSLGLAIGLENFRMTFDKNIDGIIYRYNQSWNTGWIGISYNYNIGEISDTGIRPELNLLAGATSVGPLVRGGVGLNYYINESFYLNGGFEYALLAYQESQSNSTSEWFTTNKVGFIVGFGFGF